MKIRDRMMFALLAASKKAGLQDEGSGLDATAVPVAARLALLFDGIKPGNGAGALASVAGIYSFKERLDLQFSIKIAAVTFFIGLLLHSLAILGYIVGLNSAVYFANISARLGDTGTISRYTINRGPAAYCLYCWR
jgi:hypothetical protein